MKRPEAISGVPGINLTDLRNRKAQISSELISAATEVGFFYVTGKDKTCRSCSVQCEVAQRSAGVQGTDLRKLISMRLSTNASGQHGHLVTCFSLRPNVLQPTLCVLGNATYLYI